MFKELFKKENLVLSTFDEKARKQSLLVSIIEIVLFIGTALYFFLFLSSIVEIIGSFVSGSPSIAIRDILRNLPMFLVFLSLCHTLSLVHSIHRNIDEDTRNKVVFKNSITVIVHSALCVIFVIVGRIIGSYSSLFEGYPTLLYPFDTVIVSAILIACMVFNLLKKKLPIVYGNRIPTTTGVEKGFHHFGMGVWLLTALYGFAATCYGIFTIDWEIGYQFYSVMLLLIFALPWVDLMIWEFFYNELKAETHKKLFVPSLICFGVSLLIVVLFIIAACLNIDGPSNAAMSLLVIDFTASVNATALIYCATSLIVPFIALIKAFVARKK